MANLEPRVREEGSKEAALQVMADCGPVGARFEKWGRKVRNRRTGKREGHNFTLHTKNKHLHAAKRRTLGEKWGVKLETHCIRALVWQQRKQHRDLLSSWCVVAGE